MEMTQGPMRSNILKIALPLCLTGLVQQLFNSVDTFFAGRYISSEALAAIGGNAPFINFLINIFLGLALGANIIISRYIGASEKEKASRAVGTAWILAAASGILMLFIGSIAAAPAVRLIGTPAEIEGMAVDYLGLYFASMPFFMVYNFGSAIMRSCGDSGRPLACLASAAFIKIALNYVFVMVMGLGVKSIAAASVIAYLGCSSAITAMLIRTKNEAIRLDIRAARPDIGIIAQIIKTGLPAGIQSALFSVSNIYIQSAINSLGVHAIAGSSAALNYEMYTYCIISSFVQTCVTYVSQNYGAGRPVRCRRAMLVCLGLCLLTTSAASTVFFAGRAGFIGLFTRDGADYGFAHLRMMYVVLLMPLMALFEMPCGFLRGLGYTITPTIVVLTGTFLFRILWVALVFPVSSTFLTLMLEFPLSWILTALAAAIISRRAMKKTACGTD